jgi:phosphohistidine phosphatase
MLDFPLTEIDAFAMRLILLRHAKSEKGKPGTRDLDRTLNERGLDDAATMGAFLVRHRLVPDRAVVSPARRTRETWERLAAAFPKPPPADFDDRLYESRVETILEVLRETEPTTHTLLVIGHNPGLHESARLLIATGDVEARERLNEALPTAGLVVIDFAETGWRKLHPRGGRLERFVTPRSLRTETY